MKFLEKISQKIQLEQKKEDELFMLNYEFKLLALIKNGSTLSSIIRIPSFGFVDVSTLAVKGGQRVFFDSGVGQPSQTESLFKLSRELEDLCRYKNLGIVRTSDKYSHHFNYAFQKKKELILLVSFRSYQRKDSILTSSLLIAPKARIKSFKLDFDEAERVEIIKFRFKKPKITHDDPTALAENLMKYLNGGKNLLNHLGDIF